MTGRIASEVDVALKLATASISGHESPASGRADPTAGSGVPDCPLDQLKIFIEILSDLPWLRGLARVLQVIDEPGDGLGEVDLVAAQRSQCKASSPIRPPL